MGNGLNISYGRLWKLLIDRKMKKKDLQALTKLSSAVIAKLGRDETVHLDTLLKICAALRCDLADIIEINMEEPAIEFPERFSNRWEEIAMISEANVSLNKFT